MPAGRRHVATFVEAFSLLRIAATKTVGIAFAVDVVGAVANASLIAIAGRLLGLLADDATWEQAVPWLIASAVALAVSAVCRSVHSDLTSFAAEQVESYAVERVLHAASLVPFESFDSPAFYDRLRRAHESGSRHAWSIVQGTMSLIRGCLDIAGVVIVLAFVAPVLILIAGLAFVPMWIVTVLNNRVAYRFSWAETEDDRRRAYLEELLSDRRSAKEVRSYALEERLLSRYRALWDGRLAHLRRVIKGSAVRSAIAHFASSLVVTGALAVVVWLTIRGDLSLDQAGVGVVGVRQLSNNVNRTTYDIDSLHASAQFLGDYNDFRAEAAELSRERGATRPGRPIELVELSDVSFRYPGSAVPAVAAVDMTIRSGQVTAIVGANGSGKSTLLMLLAGLYEPTSGTITWDGQDCAELSPSERLSSVAPLFQDHVQFHFSVSDNVSLSTTDPVPIRTALELAGIADVVDALPAGADTQLGKDFAGGTELSIGQWQRLALARAIHRNAPLLLLDEPASALDPTAEAELVDRLRMISADRCVVMVSHRYSSVRHADHIYMMDHGRVIEHGSHAELMATDGAYQALYRSQVELLGQV